MMTYLEKNRKMSQKVDTPWSWREASKHLRAIIRSRLLGDCES